VSHGLHAARISLAVRRTAGPVTVRVDAPDLL
jgi:hypothetical protein